MSHAEGADEDVAHRDQLCAEGIRFIGRLSHTTHSLRTYSIDSPAIRFGLEGMAAAGQGIVALGGTTRIRVIGEQISIGDFTINPPPGMVDAARRMRTWLRERGVAAIELTGPPSADDVKGMLRALYSLEPSLGELEEGDAATALQANHVQSFRFITCSPSASDDELLDEDAAVVAIRRYLRTARVLQRMHEQGPEPAIVLELMRSVQGMVDLVLSDPIRALVLSIDRDVLPYDIGHPLHRLILALVCGRRLGMQPRELLELGMAALCADLALYNLSEELLAQTRELTPAELGRVHRVPLETVQILLGAGDLSPALRRRLLVAFELRLGADRSGYPVPLTWPELHPFSRLSAVCDAYDAMTSQRPWRAAMPPEEALSRLRTQRGRRYDALMVDELDELLTTHLLGDAS
ncbi:MAG: hypothetical protein ACI8S6_001769 [Myxococcota bacterium]|jgi:hypothetical protein